MEKIMKELYNFTREYKRVKEAKPNNEAEGFRLSTYEAWKIRNDPLLLTPKCFFSQIISTSSSKKVPWQILSDFGNLEHFWKIRKKFENFVEITKVVFYVLEYCNISKLVNLTCPLRIKVRISADSLLIWQKIGTFFI